MEGGTHIIISIISGCIASLIFPGSQFFWVSYVFAIPILHDIQGTRLGGRVFKKGMLFGFIFMAIFHLWIFELHPWASWPGAIGMWLALSLYLSFFYGLTYWLTFLLGRTFRLELVFPAIWVFCEWLRSLGPYGDAGASIGFSQSHNLFTLQLGQFFGVYGLSFFCLMINVFLYQIFIHKELPLGRRVVPAISVFLLVSLLGLIQLGTPAAQNEIPVAVIQGNHKQKVKLDPQYWPKIKADYLRLNRPLSDVDLVLWPENFIPGRVLKDKTFIHDMQTIASDNTQTIIFGAAERSKGKIYNSVSIVTKDGLHPQHYQKEKLMPFGEYIPYRPIFTRLGLRRILSHFRDFSPGQNLQLLTIDGLKFGSAICLESCFSTLLQKQSKQGADILTVVVNTAWFNDTNAGEQHFQMSVLRAVENNRPLMQASNTGISAIISEKGQVLAKSNLNQQDILKASVHHPLPLSFYTKYPWLIIAMSILIILYAMKEYRRYTNLFLD